MCLGTFNSEKNMHRQTDIFCVMRTLCLIESEKIQIKEKYNDLPKHHGYGTVCS